MGQSHYDATQAMRLAEEIVPNASPAHIELYLVNGKSLLQKLCEAKRDARSRGGNVAPVLKRQLAIEYAVEESPLRKLTARDPTEPVDPEWHEALDLASTLTQRGGRLTH